MSKSRKWLLPIALGTALVLSACGGGGGSGSVAVPAPPDIGSSVTALIEYMQNLIANTDENADPVDVNALTLVVDDAGDPAPL